MKNRLVWDRQDKTGKDKTDGVSDCVVYLHGKAFHAMILSRNNVTIERRQPLCRLHF